MSNVINIEKLNKSEVLAALYNRSTPQGLGVLHYNNIPMTRNDASEILATGQKYFDYVHGRVMKIALDSEEILTTLYDRDNGRGSALRALEPLFEKVHKESDRKRKALLRRQNET